MKTSNILLIALFGSISLFFITAFAEIGLRGKLRSQNNFKIHKKNISIQQYHYIKITNLKRVKIMPGHKSGFEIITKKGDTVPAIIYDHKGDTLVIDGVKIKNRSWLNLHVYYQDSTLKALECNNAEVRINNMQLEALTLVSDNSEVHFNRNDSKSNIHKLDINIDNSNIWAHSLNVDSLNLSINKSKFHIHDEIHKVEGSLKNHSTFGLKNASEIVIKKDKTSKLDIWN